MNKTQKKEQSVSGNKFHSKRQKFTGKKKNKSELDSKLFVKKAQQTEETHYLASRLIEELPVNKSISQIY